MMSFEAPQFDDSPEDSDPLAPKPGERLWPDEKLQPVWEITLGDEIYQLRWQDTWIQYYRTGIDSYDKKLKKLDHVLHKYEKADENDGEDEDIFHWVVITLDQMGPDGMEFVLSKGYSVRTDPIPEGYMLAILAQIEIDDNAIPDFIGPEFGTAA